MCGWALRGAEGDGGDAGQGLTQSGFYSCVGDVICDARRANAGGRGVIIAPIMLCFSIARVRCVAGAMAGARSRPVHPWAARSTCCVRRQHCLLRCGQCVQRAMRTRAARLVAKGTCHTPQQWRRGWHTSAEQPVCRLHVCDRRCWARDLCQRWPAQRLRVLDQMLHTHGRRCMLYQLQQRHADLRSRRPQGCAASPTGDQPPGTLLPRTPAAH
jgi:hypothetical protein